VLVVVLRTFLSESMITSHRAYRYEPGRGTQSPSYCTSQRVWQAYRILVTQLVIQDLLFNCAGFNG